ncbi:MAG: family 20 glycosylhydrolase, partial [Bacteroidaceae bacterium]|nr:family 20 glycosylhydrolase [Bacteroidaceae bacterium]
KLSQGSVDVNQFKSVTYDDASLQSAAEYLGKAWNAPTSQQKKGTDSSIFLSLLPQKETKKLPLKGVGGSLGEEGYRLTISPKGITVQATTPQGALWGAQTLIQMKDTHFAKNDAGVITRGTLPCLTITDKPDYPIRGFMLDAGRKFFPMSYLYSLVNVMSYYKMNTLQLHLNDNGFKDQYADDWNQTQAAFRMESDFFPGLTAIDGSYSKQEMRQFIRYAETMGVEIIPEFDAPAHSLAFTHYRPSLGSEEFGADHLNLRNPEVVPFLDSLYAEYLGGPDPVFSGPRFHIGTDEYSNKDSAICERFRELIVHLCDKVKSYGKQPVFWGSLTHAKGVTPVPSDGVMMSLWYNGYADPREMHKQGFHMISIPDGLVYIVPEAGYYYNYLNHQHLYQHWEPAQIGKERFPHQDPLIDGGMFAVWNDMTKNGISVGDCHDRILPAMQVIAEKCWHAKADSTDAAWEKWTNFASLLGDGPLADEIGRKSMVNHIDLKPKATIIAPPKGSWGVSQIGYPYTIEFTIEWADEKPGTVLCTSPRSTFYLSDPIKGMLGFSRDGYLFTFKYKGKPGKRETLQLKGDNQGLSLFADGRLVERLGPDFGYKTGGKTYKIMRTLVFPLQETGDFRSKITGFSAWR